MKIHITSPTEVLALATNAKQEVAENVDESEVQAIKSSMNPAHGKFFRVVWICFSSNTV